MCWIIINKRFNSNSVYWNQSAGAAETVVAVKPGQLLGRIAPVKAGMGGSPKGIPLKAGMGGSPKGIPLKAGMGGIPKGIPVKAGMGDNPKGTWGMPGAAAHLGRP